MAAALAFLSAIWKGLRAVPWQVYAVAALALAVWAYGRHQYTAGVGAENARWVAAQAKADAKATADRKARDATAASIDDEHAEAARQASSETRTETAKAVEHVRYVTRTIEVPAHCPVGLPDSVLDEGRAAVARARAAQGPVRAGRNP